jgi:hypothetical protein
LHFVKINYADTFARQSSTAMTKAKANKYVKLFAQVTLSFLSCHPLLNLPVPLAENPPETKVQASADQHGELWDRGWRCDFFGSFLGSSHLRGAGIEPHDKPHLGSEATRDAHPRGFPSSGANHLPEAKATHSAEPQIYLHSWSPRNHPQARDKTDDQQCSATSPSLTRNWQICICKNFFLTLPQRCCEFRLQSQELFGSEPGGDPRRGSLGIARWGRQESVSHPSCPALPSPVTVTPAGLQRMLVAIRRCWLRGRLSRMQLSKPFRAPGPRGSNGLDQQLEAVGELCWSMPRLSPPSSDLLSRFFQKAKLEEGSSTSLVTEEPLEDEREGEQAAVSHELSEMLALEERRKVQSSLPPISALG